MGDAGRRDPARVVFWTKRAAAAGDGDSMVELGIMYAYGTDGVAKNPVKAEKWLIRSALSGWPGAVPELAEIYHVSEVRRRGIKTGTQIDN